MPIYAKMMCGLLQKQEMELHLFFLGRENDEKPWIGMGFSVPTCWPMAPVFSRNHRSNTGPGVPE
jgi:hypothetical protein